MALSDTPTSGAAAVLVRRTGRAKGGREEGGARRQKEGETEDICTRAGERAYHQLAAGRSHLASQPIIRQSKQSASSNTDRPARGQLTEMSRGDKLRTAVGS